jgi:uncharacterized membrane protein
VRFNFPLWLIPMIYAAGSVIIGVLFPRFEYEYLNSYSHGMSVASAQAFLSAVASGMMSLTAIVFSIAFVIMQFSATAYSKRLILLFGRDPILFHTLGMLVATFIYALATLAYVDHERNGKVPYFSTEFVIVLLVLSVMLLALLVHSLAQLQITSVLRRVGDKGRQVIRETFPPTDIPHGGATRELRQRAEQIQSGTPLQTLTYSGQPRAVTHFDIDAFVKLAHNAGVVIVTECAVGDIIADGAVLMHVYGTGNPIPDRALREPVHLAWNRTFDQDPKYPLRLLVDTAIMALSPAVNDPTTAVQSIDQIEDLLHRLGLCDLDAGYVQGADGQLRFIFPMPTWEDYLSLAFDEIRLFGADSPQVLRRLRSALNDILASLRNADRADAVRRYLRHLDDDISHSHLDEQDRAMARQEDRQGLGVTRRVR